MVLVHWFLKHPEMKKVVVAEPGFAETFGLGFKMTTLVSFCITAIAIV